jgi:ABC-2 type transport system permease protein
MVTILRHNFWRSRGQILGWGIGLALLGVYVLAFYSTIMEQREQIERLLEGYPPEVMAFFGGAQDFFTPSGYIHAYFFSYMPLVAGIFAVLAGSGMLVRDEENGILDLVLAHPISRTRLFWGRLLAFIATTFAILAITYLGLLFVLPTSEMNISILDLALPFVSLLALLMFFGGLALLFSLLLPSSRTAAMASGMVLVASYFITSMANLDENIERMARFSPVTYMQGGHAVEGLNWEWFMGLVSFSLVFALLSWFLFEKRDIRVGGEGGWRLPVRSTASAAPDNASLGKTS